MVNVRFTFEETVNAVLQSICVVLRCQQQCKSSSFSTSLPTADEVGLFNLDVPLDVQWYLNAVLCLIPQRLMKHVFMCYLSFVHFSL